METTSGSLEAQIRAIESSGRYIALLTKHRGPLEERELQEMRIRINALRTQQRGLEETNPPVPVAPPSKKGHRKANFPITAAEANSIKGPELVPSVFHAPPTTPLAHPPQVLKPRMSSEAPPSREGAVKTSLIRQPYRKNEAPLPPPPSPLRGDPRPSSQVKPPGNAAQKGMAPPPAPRPKVKTEGKFSTVNKKKPGGRGSVKAKTERLDPSLVKKASALPVLKEPEEELFDEAAFNAGLDNIVTDYTWEGEEILADY